MLNTPTLQLIKLQPSPAELTTSVRGASAQRNRDNLWAEFGQLKIADSNRKQYVKAIENFCQFAYSGSATSETISEFLTLDRYAAIEMVLRYRRHSIDKKLAPSTINVRLAAIKSLVDMARKLGKTTIDLTDIESIPSESYRDTRGISVEQFKLMLEAIDPSTPIGVRDYAIMLLFWGNALRRGEIASANIEDWHWLSRLEAKQLPVQFQPCCLNDLVSDLEEELAPLAIASSIDLRLEISVKQSIDVMGDSDRLYRAIANLIHNAIQYTPANGIVTIRLESSERNAIITVQDNGIGITEADLPHIFDRFYRVQADRSRNTGGTGLGLAIVRAIVQAHHGSIQVNSQLDLGSTFTVSLPIKVAPSNISSQNKTT